MVVHYPKTEEGKRELARRIAGTHADMVNQYISKLNCPFKQKEQLLNSIIDTAKKKAGEQGVMHGRISKMKHTDSLTARPDQGSVNGEKKPSNAVLRNPKNCTEHDTAECEGLPKWKSNASSPLTYRV